MESLIEKISSYNIFNYLFPGVVFVMLLSKVSNHNFIQDDLIVSAFFYYFVGLVISRVGSIIIEPFFELVRIIKKDTYSRYVAAAKEDSILEVLSEVNNMYRTICSMVLILALIKLYDNYLAEQAFFMNYEKEVAVGVLLVLFVFSYRKQTGYITKRIKANLEKK